MTIKLRSTQQESYPSDLMLANYVYIPIIMKLRLCIAVTTKEEYTFVSAQILIFYGIWNAFFAIHHQNKHTVFSRY